MSRHLPTLCAAALLAATWSCRTVGPGTNSAVLHDEGEPTRSDAPWQWQATTESDFQTVIIPFMELGGPAQILPASHALTRRAQFWLDRIDAMLRKKYPERLAPVPKPVARVWKNADPNAFVSPVPVCLDVAVRFEAKDGAKKTVPRAFLSPAGLVEPPPGEGCVKRSHTVAALAAFVTWYNQEHPSCTLRLEGSPPTVVVGANCRLDPQFQGKGGAKRLVFYATSSWVIFHSGIFETYPAEAQFVAIAAHELGHYYRAHPSASEEQYNYFYRLKERNEAKRPPPDASLGTFGLSVNDASKILYGSKKVSGQRYPSELFFGTWNLLIQAAGDHPTGEKSCDAFRTFVSGEGEKAFGDFPQESLAPQGIAAYKKWEALVAACAPKVSLTDVEAGKLALTREAVGVAFTEQDARLGVLAQDLGATRTLEEALGLIAKRLDDARQPAFEVLERAEAEELGYYTMEQEADEEANEWLDELGFTPRHAAEAYFSIGAWIYAHGHALEHTAVSMPDCRKLYEAGWKRPDGSPYFVPIADYLNEHHTPCYRIFDITREIQAHGLRQADSEPPTPPAPPWAEIRKASAAVAKAKDESAGAPKAGFPIWR